MSMLDASAGCQRWTMLAVKAVKAVKARTKLANSFGPSVRQAFGHSPFEFRLNERAALDVLGA